MKVSFKQTLALLLALALILPAAVILSRPLTADAAETSKYQNSMELEPVKLPADTTTADFVKNPDQPHIYTLRSDFKVERDKKEDGTTNYAINYQPYVATVGEDATKDEKDKVKKTIKLPDFLGYDKPKDNFVIDYNTVVNEGNPVSPPSGDNVCGKADQKTRSFDYKAIENEVTIKHVFQDLNDFDKYGPKPGETKIIETTQKGAIGSDLKVKPLKDDEIAGFIPEADSITVQVPQDTKNFSVEYRYNRNHYDVTFDTDGGTEVPSRTLYYGQVIPNLEQKDIPTKVGATFQGWKPSVDLKDNSGKTTFKAGEVIKDSSGNAIKDLNAKLIMPAENVKFTAVWKDNPEADYAIQFWTEKADYPEGASLLERYDFVGTHVYKNQATGTRPDLEKETVKGVEFPDLDQARLDKIWNKQRFNRGKDLFLNKFYKYNKDLTDKENADPNSPNLVKTVSSTGKTVYNIYYDRQVYDLYFTKSNAKTGDQAEATFYPEIWRHGKKLGEPGNPYHFKARFNQLMTEWPDDAQETKGFSEGKQSFGWSPNFNNPQWIYRDTPPYRLSAEEFLDMDGYDIRGGYTKRIDAGNGVIKDLKWFEFTTLSFGIEQRGGPKETTQPMPHHMDFWMDGFEPGETIIDYNLYRTKADTAAKTYGHKYPKVQGFTPYGTAEVSEQLDVDELAEVNEERKETTPLPDEQVIDPYGNDKTKGDMQFMKTFFNRADEFGDVADDSEPFDKNGYIRFKYHRNKYKLRFNNDPANPKDDSEYNQTNQTEVFYQKPLKDLNLDDPQTLIDLELTDLVEKDDNGKDRIKRPEGLAPQMVFKGWALDPAGQKLVWENKETMPAHNLVLYAKWGEPDYKWKVTFDPNGGKLDPIEEKNVTTGPKTIRDGDIADQKEVTYPIKGKNEGDKQVFTVVQRQKLVEPKKRTREGYSFMGWEVLRYKKDASGNYTEEVDDSYRKTYKVPELYSYGNDVVSPIYLKAIWVKNDMQDVKVFHHFLDNNLAIDKTVKDNPVIETKRNQRADKYVAAIGSRQDANWILASDADLQNTKDEETKKLYDDYQKLADELGNRATKGNTYFQTLRIEPKQILEDGKLVDNPKSKDNEFHFFYRPFRTRNFKVNYVDQRAQAELAKATTDAEKKKIIEKYRILDQKPVTSQARHYDACNYKPITGWRLTSKPQQQLFYDVDEDTNEFKGINGTGSDEITFYYQDVRVIEVPSGSPTPPEKSGYVRVTFKASKGGSFGKDKDGKPITEINYDVLKGLKSDLLPVPQELENGKQPDENKYYVTPEEGKSFIKWDKESLLPSGTEINENHTFTAQFDWSDLMTKGVATTESFKTPDGTWINNFVPTLDELKAAIQLQSKDKTKITKLPEGATVKFVDDQGNEVNTQDDLYNLVKEEPDSNELVRTVKLKAKVQFAKESEPREIDVPIRVYKNRYDAPPTATGTMPDFLMQATGPHGDLAKLLDGKTYVKVTVKPSSRLGNLPPKSYWVNPKAWVEIPEIAVSDKDKAASGFKHWSANKAAQNEGQAKLGVYDFMKRHKFSEDTVITPVFVEKVVTPVPEKKPNKPIVSPGPVTGANALVYLYAAALFTAAGIALVISRTRRKAQRA
ncbi:InlB B-repeat-containing protein [Varibaculum prostatecancerukia]|uniref:InlB B-repeat-containing protein n=1 Tax=Varibaculum prostatecancerukia TaxID=2811781 RepID=UPI001C0026DD|nr:InlB B-repeat-containing protein [Varibaculum prostatecancerukia]